MCYVYKIPQTGGFVHDKVDGGKTKHVGKWFKMVYISLQKGCLGVSDLCTTPENVQTCSGNVIEKSLNSIDEYTYEPCSCCSAVVCELSSGHVEGGSGHHPLRCDECDVVATERALGGAGGSPTLVHAGRYHRPRTSGKQLSQIPRMQILRKY